MKKTALGLTICLVLLSGCRRKTWFSWRSSDKKMDQCSEEQAQKSQKSLFVDDVDAFMLEDDTDLAGNHVSPVKMKLSAEEDEQPLQNEASRQEFKALYFDFDKYDVRKDQKDALSYNAKKINKLIGQGHTVMVEGHSCEFARDEEYNLMISDKRAQEVYHMLINSYNVPEHGIKYVGRGCGYPRVFGGSKKQQAPNRRVEFYIID